MIGEISLAVISCLDAVMLYLMATTNNIIVAYIGHVVFRALFQMMITVASFEIARNINKTSNGLVFGFNTFLALAFQTILTTVVADSAGLALPPRTQVKTILLFLTSLISHFQFQVYAGFFLVVGAIFLVTGSITLATGGVTRLRQEGWWRSDQDKQADKTED